MGNQQQENTKRQRTFKKETGRGAIILVLGILSMGILGPMGGITAWVMANNDLKKIDAGLIPESERSIIKAGKILGIIGTFLVFALVVFGIFTVVGINMITAQ